MTGNLKGIGVGFLCALIGACSGRPPEVLPWPGWCGTSPSAMWQTIPCDASVHFALPEKPPEIGYPPVLEQAGISGHVIVALAIGERGSVDQVTILNSTNRGFNGGVDSTLRLWQFVPRSSTGADARNRPARRRLDVMIRFQPGPCRGQSRPAQGVQVARSGLLIEVLGCWTTVPRTVSPGTHFGAA